MLTAPTIIENIAKYSYIAGKGRIWEGFDATSTGKFNTVNLIIHQFVHAVWIDLVIFSCFFTNKLHFICISMLIFIHRDERDTIEVLGAIL